MKATDIALAFADALDQKFTPQHQRVSVQPGRVYDKIVMENIHSGSKSVHAFVNRKTGEIIKPASWAQPQRNADGSLSVRFNLSTPVGFHQAVSEADPFGSYLYVK